MIKFPSVQVAVQATAKTILRFPFETITTIFGTICSILLLEKDYDDPYKDFLLKSIMSASLCLVLSLSVSLFFLATKKNNIFRFLTNIILASFVTAFVFSFKTEPTTLEMQQFLVLSIALHLLVSFAGFIPKPYNQEEFWEFNKQLFLRILTALLYSIVIYSGLALAIFAVKELFSIDFGNKIYGNLFFIIVGVFNTIFFLSGIPDTNNAQQPLKLNYPNGLKNFTQYVLLPLISLYLAILIGYEIKIITTLSLPIGWVSYLVLVFAIFGILSFLLVHPIATQTNNLWIKSYTRLFYYLLIPLLGLLFWAILYRIFLYGFTHDRYYVLLLSVWLSIVVAYFLINKQPKIKFIPISMCIAGLLSIVGPQSADNIARNSQIYRFKTYMQQIQTKKLSFEQEKDLSSIIDFLETNYSVNVLVPYTNNKLTVLLKKDKNPNSADIMESLGLNYHNKYDQKGAITSNSFYYQYIENENNSMQNIHSYDLSFLVTNYHELDCKNCTKINNTPYTVKSVKKPYGFDLQINKDTIPLRIFDFINTNTDFDNNNNQKRITQLIQVPKYDILITYLIVDGSKINKKKVTENYTTKILVKIK